MERLGRELGIPWQEWALHGGEEYALLFSAGRAFDPACRPGGRGATLVHLGSFTRSLKGVHVQQGEKVVKLELKGWDHVAVQDVSPHRRGKK
jgi:thiamine monophosphate kinase